MKLYRIFILILLLFPALLPAQNNSGVTAPDITRFSATLDYLSSGWMEGREAGEKGGFMAAGFIETMMRWAGLQPYGDVSGNVRRTFFQDFDIVKYKTLAASVTIEDGKAATPSLSVLKQEEDFTVISAYKSAAVSGPVVFAGYGIHAPVLGYDDYKGLDVKNRVVLILAGFPGHNDTASVSWKRFSTAIEPLSSNEEKVKTAARAGALAVILISTEKDKSFEPKSLKSNTADTAVPAADIEDAVYEDWNFSLEADTSLPAIPCYAFSSEASLRLLRGSNVNPSEFEKSLSQNPVPVSSQLKNKAVRLSVEVSQSLVNVRNVLGVIPGRDTSRCVIVGAHYDHLGKRNNMIYYGADDNASGVSGLVSLATKWVQAAEKPPVNLVFASWTAEEKGLLGSAYFARHPVNGTGQILVYLNMDMISRDDPSDSVHRQLSIGTRTADEYLRQIARDNNAGLSRPFALDLWDVTGHSGSDYASFTAINVPVMTFFSGFHPDYHSPRDVSSKADLAKSALILKLVDECLAGVLKLIDK